MEVLVIDSVQKPSETEPQSKRGKLPKQLPPCETDGVKYWPAISHRCNHTETTRARGWILHFLRWNLKTNVGFAKSRVGILETNAGQAKSYAGF